MHLKEAEKKKKKKKNQLYVTFYTLSIYTSVHNQLIRTIFEVHILCKLLQNGNASKKHQLLPSQEIINLTKNR